MFSFFSSEEDNLFAKLELFPAFIKQVALNVAPGSTASFPVTTSPSMFAVALKLSVPFMSNIPFTSPSMSASLQLKAPIITPV